MKTLRKTKTKNTTTSEQVPSEPTRRKQQDGGHYKVYVRSDEVNGQLVEGLAPITWPEFLNHEIPEGATEDDLAHTLVPGEFYVVGKRLVKYLYTITATRIIVCDLARLTPVPDDNYKQWKHRYANAHPVDLDADEYKKQEEEKKKEVEQQQKNIKEITHDILV